MQEIISSPIQVETQEPKDVWWFDLSYNEKLVLKLLLKRLHRPLLPDLFIVGILCQYKHRKSIAHAHKIL